MAIENKFSSLFGFSTPQDMSYYYNLPGGQGEHPASRVILDFGDGINTNIDSRNTIAENANWEIYSQYDNSTFFQVYIREKSTNYTVTIIPNANHNCGNMYICLGADPEMPNRYQSFYACENNYGLGNSSITINTDVIDRFLADTPLVTYIWQSVQSISGKNNTVSLTTLKEESINDGSPVDDATESAFNNAPNSCSVGGIVSKDLPIVDDNPLSIAVKYNIPELTDSVYSSCKVVAKKNKIPKSKTDGDKILDVSPSSHGCVIKGLEQETKYYVVVFVEDSFGNKAESEPGGPVRTGKQSGIFFDRISVMQEMRDVGIKDSVSVSQV